jgi:hypothetical protein
MLKETAIFVGAGKPHAYIECRFAGNVGARFPCWLVEKKSFFFFRLIHTWLFFSSRNTDHNFFPLCAPFTSIFLLRLLLLPFDVCIWNCTFNR